MSSSSVAAVKKKRSLSSDAATMHKKEADMVAFIMGPSYTKEMISGQSYKLINSDFEVIYHSKQYTIIDKRFKDPVLYKNVEVAYERITGTSMN